MNNNSLDYEPWRLDFNTCSSVTLTFDLVAQILTWIYEFVQRLGDAVAHAVLSES